MSSALILKLSPRASRDLVSISRYTRNVWGDAQVTKYASKISAAFDRLVQNPQLGSFRDDLPPDERVYLVGKHAIIFRQLGNVVEILRILHQHMNRADHA